jgi:hypothetical protein
MTASEQSRKWQTVNLVTQHTVFVHRTQIQQATLNHGAARDLKLDHANEIKFGRVSDPYGDFSPLLLTLFPKDNPQLPWNDEKKLKRDLIKKLQFQTVEIMGGAEEKVASVDLKFTVFGHQHLFQV